VSRAPSDSETDVAGSHASANARERAPAAARGDASDRPRAEGATPSVYAALAFVQLFFGLLPVAVKIVLREMTSPALALVRVAGAAAVFVVVHRLLVGERIRDRRDYAALALYALCGVVLNQLLYITALTLTTATAAQMVMTAGPAITLLIAIVLGRERATPLRLVGIAVAGSGALYMVGAHLGNALGNLLALLNVIAYSIYLVISRGLLRKYHPLTVITWVFLFGALGMLPWGIVPFVRQAPHLSGQAWATIAFIVLLPTVGAYWLNVFALKRVESSVVAVFTYAQPIVTALAAALLLRERPSPRLVPAALLIFGGVAIAGA
jgi:drug/metabolite transporter (DMT)-like permease